MAGDLLSRPRPAGRRTPVRGDDVRGDDVRGGADETGVRPATRRSVVLAAVLVVVGVALLLLRTREHLAAPTFYAEDGTVFYSQARIWGTAAFWHPYAGYLHLIPRLVTAAVAPLPISVAPAATVAAATAADLVLLAPLLSRRLAWLLPSPAARALLFAVVVVLPPAYETLGNVANLIFMGGITLVALALSDSPRTRPGQAIEILAIAVLALSGPLVVLVLPLFAYRVYRIYRIYRTIDRMRALSSWLLLGTAALGGVVQIGVLLNSARTTAGGGRPAEFVVVVAERQPGTLLFGTPAAAQLIGAHSVWALSAIAVWLLLAAVIAWRALGGVLAAVVGLTFAVLLAAPVWAYGRSMEIPGFGDRHMVLPMVLIVLVLVAGLFSPRLRGRLTVFRIAAGVLLLSGEAGVASQFDALPWTVPTDTAALTRCLHSDAARCAVPISPSVDGWTVVLRGTPPS